MSDVTNVMELAQQTALHLDMMWVAVCAALVFLMQAGFLIFEAGVVRPKNIVSVAVKNLIDWVVISLIYFLFGFGLMFGASSGGFMGNSLFMLEGVNSENGSSLGVIFFMFQLAFAVTAATIISGAMSERTGLIAYLCGSIIVGMLIYPVFGYWVWGNAFFGDNKPWLAEMGFVDFAGSTVVHSVGGWVALVGCWMIGPRIGRYSSSGEIRPMKSFNFPLASLGVFILWFGWWGFNGGSGLSFNSDVGGVLVNTNIAAAAAGFSAFFYSFFFQDRDSIYEKLMGGILGGLVAITACCHVVTPVSAALIGLTAGVIHNWGYDILQKKMCIDDPVGAIPVHLVCGVYGTLCVALFGEQELLSMPRMEQLKVQLIGILACMGWTTVTAFIMFKVLKKTVGLRVSPKEEKRGIHLVHDVSIYQPGEEQEEEQDKKEEKPLSEEELMKLMGGE